MTGQHDNASLHPSSPQATVANTLLFNTPALKGATSLASNITSVLSASYSDREFRDALALLDGRQVQNDARTRRHIRMDLHKELLDSNGAIIIEFGRVAEQLNRIKSTLDRLNSGYQHMKGQIETAHLETSSALSEATTIMKQRQHVETREGLLDAFREHFTMSTDEITALTISAEPVDTQFFNALAKSKRIRKECEVLLGFEKQTLGLELIDQASNNINLGFQKLYKWVQREFKYLNFENPQMNPSVRHALRVLAERPSLFQSCLDFFAEAREKILSESFYTTLTGTSSLGLESDSYSSKPIDLTAHDPLRYVGDMLAWIHSATVSEREALEVLFVAEGEELVKGLNSGRDAEIWRRVEEHEGLEQESDFNAMKALHDLVDHDISGATRLLRQRVEQVTQSNEDIITAYKLANLIDFYSVMFQKLLGSDSGLMELMNGLEAEAMRQFRALVREHIATLEAEFQQPPLDLVPPRFLQVCLQRLETFVKTYDSSLVTGSRETGFENILVETFDPFIAGCENMATGMTSPDSNVFLINCRQAAILSLGDYDFTLSRTRQVQAKLDSESKTLIMQQYIFFSENSGLEDLMAGIQENGQLSEEKLEVTRLGQASQALDDFLPSALMDAMDRLKHLQDTSLARYINEEAAERFCEAFERLEEAVIAADADDDDGNDNTSEREYEGGGRLRTAFPRTTAEIRVLLS